VLAASRPAKASAYDEVRFHTPLRGSAGIGRKAAPASLLIASFHRDERMKTTSGVEIRARGWVSSSTRSYLGGALLHRRSAMASPFAVKPEHGDRCRCISILRCAYHYAAFAIDGSDPIE